jgi:phospholipid/cholesterol/gamma-HCH transport system substrate-binding protein
MAGEDTYELHVWFDDVTGLAKGTRVTTAGFKIGTISGLTLAQGKVRVTIRILSRIKVFSGKREVSDRPLQHAARLSRLQASLIGEYYLELSPGAAGRPLREGEFIPEVATVTGLQKAFERLDDAADLLPRLERVAAHVEQVSANAAEVWGTPRGKQRLEELTGQTIGALNDLRELTRSVRARLDSGTLAHGGALDRGVRQFDHAMRRAAHAADQMADAAAAVRELAGPNDAQPSTTARNLLARFDDAARRADGALERVDRMVAKVEQGEGSMGRLLNDDTLVRQTEGAVAGVKDLLDQYTRLEVGIDYRVAGYSQAVLSNDDDRLRWQSHLGLRLQPRPDRWVQAWLTTDNLGKLSELRRATTTTTGGVVTTVDTLQRDTEQTWKFGLVYGRRWGALALRGGLIESTAGAGVSIFMWRDRLRLEADLFRFTGNEHARLRAGLWAELLPHLFAWVGGDELLWPDRRDIFAGAGLAFTDNDLKILFAAAPSVGTR